jgi:hypothetical protein
MPFNKKTTTATRGNADDLLDTNRLGSNPIEEVVLREHFSPITPTQRVQIQDAFRPSGSSLYDSVIQSTRGGLTGPTITPLESNIIVTPEGTEEVFTQGQEKPADIKTKGNSTILEEVYVTVRVATKLGGLIHPGLKIADAILIAADIARGVNEFMADPPQQIDVPPEPDTGEPILEETILTETYLPEADSYPTGEIPETDYSWMYEQYDRGDRPGPMEELVVYADRYDYKVNTNPAPNIQLETEITPNIRSSTPRTPKKEQVKLTIPALEELAGQPLNPPRYTIPKQNPTPAEDVVGSPTPETGGVAQIDFDPGDDTSTETGTITAPDPSKDRNPPVLKIKIKTTNPKEENKRRKDSKESEIPGTRLYRVMQGFIHRTFGRATEIQDLIDILLDNLYVSGQPTDGMSYTEVLDLIKTKGFDTVTIDWEQAYSDFIYNAAIDYAIGKLGAANAQMQIDNKQIGKWMPRLQGGYY